MIAFNYPVTPTGEPERMSAAAIAALARALRERVAGSRVRQPSLDAIIARTAALSVNGRRMRMAWDIEHDVSDDNGQPVLGACLHDPVEPDTVMIYVNGERLAERPEVLRSTAVHELAHAVFDMPSALGGPARRAFRTIASQEATVPARQGPIDWAEWRADAFMGSFLVPPHLLVKAVARIAGAIPLRLSWRQDRLGGAAPFIDGDPRSEGVGWLIDELAEEFGVSLPFITMRLRRGGIIGQRVGAGERR
jgi:Zn-dependent peptidase ImmA (M78 family)